MPERAPIAGRSARGADIAPLAKAPPNYLDTTHFDTVRFPPPSWACETFARAARDGSLAYTGYRGNPDVLKVLAESVGRFVGIPLDPAQNLILTPGTQAGLSLHDAVKVDVFLRDIADRAVFDAIYAEYVGNPPPARTLIQSNFTEFDVEVSAVLVRKVTRILGEGYLDVGEILVQDIGPIGLEDGIMAPPGSR